MTEKVVGRFASESIRLWDEEQKIERPLAGERFDAIRVRLTLADYGRKRVHEWIHRELVPRLSDAAGTVLISIDDLLDGSPPCESHVRNIAKAVRPMVLPWEPFNVASRDRQLAADMSEALTAIEKVPRVDAAIKTMRYVRDVLAANVRLRYRLSMQSAYDAGDKRHPELIIRALAPDATDLEPFAIGDCWLFTATEIPLLPACVELVAEKSFNAVAARLRIAAGTVNFNESRVLADAFQAGADEIDRLTSREVSATSAEIAVAIERARWVLERNKTSYVDDETLKMCRALISLRNMVPS